MQWNIIGINPLCTRNISNGILFLTSGALVLVNTSVKIYNITAAAPAGLVIDVAVYDALKLSGPLHGCQGRAGSSVPWRVVKHLLFIELEKPLRPGIVKCTGIHFLNAVAIPVLDVICLILFLNTDEPALFHHTGTAESHSIGTIIQKLPQLSYFFIHSDTPFQSNPANSPWEATSVSYYHYYIIFSR